MASWDSGKGTVTDAFKADQAPGASGPMGGGVGVASAPAEDAAGGSPTTVVHGGVDSGLGGLY
jgi:penicillin-binding protein 1A